MMCEHLAEALGVINTIAANMHYHGLMLNERYLHHYFSAAFQRDNSLLNLMGNTEDLRLHPEWPTYKEQTGIDYGRYTVDMPTTDGTAAKIDFALGQYASPDVAVEFSLKAGWNHKEVRFDFLRLLDNRNPFRAVISFNVLLRPNGLAWELLVDEGEDLGGHPHLVVVPGRMANLHERIVRAHAEALNRLGPLACDAARHRYFLVTEIAPDNSRRHWYYDVARGDFLVAELLPTTFFS
jgi:hypothetical protein